MGERDEGRQAPFEDNESMDEARQGPCAEGRVGTRVWNEGRQAPIEERTTKKRQRARKDREGEQRSPLGKRRILPEVKYEKTRPWNKRVDYKEWKKWRKNEPGGNGYEGARERHGGSAKQSTNGSG